MAMMFRLYSAFSLFLPNATETTHNSIAACRRKDNTNTAQKREATMTSHYLASKGNRTFDFCAGVFRHAGQVRLK
jgi:hypothetical protein